MTSTCHVTLVLRDFEAPGFRCFLYNSLQTSRTPKFWTCPHHLVTSACHVTMTFQDFCTSGFRICYTHILHNSWMSNFWILVSQSFGTLGLWNTSHLYTLKLSITELPYSWSGPCLSRWHHHVTSLQHFGTLGLWRFPQHNSTFLLNVKVDNSLNYASLKFLDTC